MRVKTKNKSAAQSASIAKMAATMAPYFHI
jgi:hypothetical protein